MNHDLELEQWQSLWRAEVAVPSNLRTLAKQHLRRMRLMFYADVAVTVIFGGGLTLWSLFSSQSSVRALAVYVWVLLLAAWIFRWFNRGNWTGTAPNTEVFLEKLRTSYQASLRNLKFGWLLGIVQLAFLSAWVYKEVNKTLPLTIGQFLSMKISLVIWACLAGLLGWTVLLFLKLSRQLNTVTRLQRELSSFDDEPAKVGKRQNTLPAGHVAFFLQSLVDSLLRLEGAHWPLRRKKNKIL
jgi:hypothetical protein